ncbi:DNA segregation ATPase FtsK/SpoIIIE -like protein [Pseudomonas caricapapayae]|uniref:DNA segregation ATPase FtsK/SpoIIIE-like protein n=1 Tax=Pseudomonas caricapapayae TaxID=46678 RepID=A0A3M6ENM5_9PSED|nr:DNA translocase FtsK [Pseudomonas caricapapayae]RMV69948.1 DNA segregation ATPase FtsK/SpoIIIE -like protein [Pseudomonas caricapapayae]
MKVEHIEAIERARRHGVAPMMFAHQLMVRDLVEAALFELRNIKVPFPRLGEDDQQEVIDRLTKQAEEVVTTAISIISSRSVDTIPVTVVDAKFKAKAITVTAAIDAQDPNRHGLIDVAGKLCLLVLAPNDYAEGTDGIRAERDQRELPLSAGAIAEAMHRGRFKSEENDPDFDEVEQRDLEQAPQQHKQAMEEHQQLHGKEFGEYTYEDASQLVVLHATNVDVAWLQRRLAIDSDQATTLLLRLVDNQVIELETEAEQSIDNTYKVIAELGSLCVE